MRSLLNEFYICILTCDTCYRSIDGHLTIFNPALLYKRVFQFLVHSYSRLAYSNIKPDISAPVKY